MKYEFTVELMNGQDWLTTIDCEAEIKPDDDGSWAVAAIAHWSEDRSKLDKDSNCFERAYMPIDRKNCMGTEIYRQALATLSLSSHSLKIGAAIAGSNQQIRRYDRMTDFDYGIGQHGPYRNKGLRA